MAMGIPRASAIFGRYWSAHSAVHSLDARTKAIGLLVYMVAVFLCTSPLTLGICALFCAAGYLVARIPVSRAVQSIAPLLFIVVITALLNIFFVQGGTEYLRWGPIAISEVGVDAAVFMACRLTLLLLGASLVTLTTTVLDLSDATEKMLTPLARFGFPAHESAIMASIALRFLPQFIDEFMVIRSAQMARGAQLTTSPLKGTRHLSALLVPLFTSVFRHAETLADAMDARCYHGGVGRTHLHPLHFERRDGIAAVALVLLVVVICTLNITGNA